jgi:hypothetical protein
MPALFGIADHRDFLAIATGENVRGTYVGTDAAGFAFVIMNDGWHLILLSDLNSAGSVKPAQPAGNIGGGFRDAAMYWHLCTSSSMQNVSPARLTAPTARLEVVLLGTEILARGS